MYTVEAVEERVIGVIADLTRDWDVEIEGGMTSGTSLVADVDFASIDFIQMAVAIESEFKTKLGFQDLLMQGGKYVGDVTVRQIAEFVAERLNNGVPTAPTSPVVAEGQRVTSVPEAQRITAAMLATFRRRFPARDLHDDGTPKNERAVFVLSPPRSGSTLLRILLAGNSRLFAPPELHLLPYRTMADRRKALSGAHTDHLLEGVARALMQLNGWEAEQALSFVAACEQQGMTTKAFYRELQAPLEGERLLVDKTPWYVVDVDILKRIDRDFVDPLYIHLVRHPLGMVRSYEESSMQRLLPPNATQEGSFGSRELAELTWLLAQQNTLEISKHVSADRWLQVRYEDLVVEPEAVLRRMCSFIGVPYESAMANPYDDMDRRMTDGVASASRMSGDLKFHLHNAINPEAAVRWRNFYSEDVLGSETRELAAALGY